MDRFTRGDVAIAYRDAGSGLPVVLLHAFATGHALWEPQLEALAGSFRAVAPDLRGFGDSSDTDGLAVPMDEYADDVVALLDHLAIERAVIAGISLGGYVALSLAIRHPRRAAGLVLANTRAGADDPQWAGSREALVADILARGPAAVVESYGDKPFGPRCPPDVKARVRAMILRQRVEGLASGMLGMATRPDRRAALPSIAMPTLVVSGTRDQYIPSSEGDAMHGAIRDSRFVDIPEAGHLSNADSPGAFNTALRAFLESIAAP